MLQIQKNSRIIPKLPMILSQRIIQQYTDRSYCAKKVFLVSLSDFEELVSLDKVGELQVIKID